MVSSLEVAPLKIFLLLHARSPHHHFMAPAVTEVEHPSSKTSTSEKRRWSPKHSDTQHYSSVYFNLQASLQGKRKKVILKEERK
jgi:hypothetical protein